jgi:phage baseplate assembly protein W
MLYMVSGKRSSGQFVNFAPKSEIDEILQNVYTLLRTAKYSVPLDRDLGIDMTFIDRPAPDAMFRARSRIPEEIERYEPRAKVRVIEFRLYEGESERGMFYPVLQIEINEDKLTWA